MLLMGQYKFFVFNFSLYFLLSCYLDTILKTFIHKYTKEEK